MSDYRNFNDDPLRPGTPYEYEPVGQDRNWGWGWIAGALVLVVLAALAFGVGHGPTQTASNETTPGAATRMMPVAPPTTTPRPLNPASPGLTPPPAPQTNTQPQ
jgi:hypothetical protein